MNSARPAAVFEADIGDINGFDSGDTNARQGSHSASLWGSGWGKSSASPTLLSRRAGKPGRQQRGQGNRTRPQQEGWTEMSQDIVKGMDDLYGNVSFSRSSRSRGRQAASNWARDAAKACVVGGAMGAIGGSAVPGVGTWSGAVAGCAMGVIGLSVDRAYDETRRDWSSDR